MLKAIGVDNNDALGGGEKAVIGGFFDTKTINVSALVEIAESK